MVDLRKLQILERESTQPLNGILNLDAPTGNGIH